MLKHHVLTVTPKTVDTLLPPVWVFGNPGVSKHQCVFTLQCFETPGVSKHLVFRNTKTGGSRVSTIFGVSKHFFFTVYRLKNADFEFRDVVTELEVNIL